jgi:hypothetical protein
MLLDFANRCGSDRGGGEPLAAPRGVSDTFKRCKQRPSKFLARHSLTLTLPQPPKEISKLPLVMLYGRNRHIHQTFHQAQIRGLRNVGLALHRIQGDQ